jgi:hypothetical protein
MTFEKIDIFSTSHTFFPDKRKPEYPPAAGASGHRSWRKKIRDGPDKNDRHVEDAFGFRNVHLKVEDEKNPSGMFRKAPLPIYRSCIHR